ncbi:FCD domain-containing protein [Devosia algicola]|uniref:FCD domain-containing protein n=1 Tax=Devosia algicola TaxID=3026418 RepID=A0ABY7YTT7_9HYPH|nr:FCD domain-containing protein [Devosia algicola]WDR04374.1 FCD domain-containing protein [Devosia algicola]
MPPQQQLTTASSAIFARRLSLTHGRERAIQEHQLILDACRNGDVMQAAALTRDHVLQASISLTKFLSQQG